MGDCFIIDCWTFVPISTYNRINLNLIGGTPMKKESTPNDQKSDAHNPTSA